MPYFPTLFPAKVREADEVFSKAFILLNIQESTIQCMYACVFTRASVTYHSYFQS